MGQRSEYIVQLEAELGKFEQIRQRLEELRHSSDRKVRAVAEAVLA